MLTHANAKLHGEHTGMSGINNKRISPNVELFFKQKKKKAQIHVKHMYDCGGVDLSHLTVFKK